MSFKRSCPRCTSAWDASVGFCPKDGSPLGPATLDRYELVRQLDHAGMSEVYEARHSHTGRRVAIKLIASSLVARDENSARLRREGRAASAIGDPNIVDVTDFGTTEDGAIYMVMEWLEGRTLREFIDAGPIPPMDALEIGAQIAKGLASAHNIGVVHRDVKPENLMLIDDSEGKPLIKILDFGIAKMMDPGTTKLTRTGTIMGTPAYMSPEQARSEEVDGRSDIYSLGCVLYELFTGTPPFSAASPMELVLMHTGQRPELPSVRAPKRNIASALDQLIMRCLEKDPTERHASMAKLRRELLALQGGSGMMALGRDSSRQTEAMDSAKTLMYRAEEPQETPWARPQPGTHPVPFLPPPIQSPARSRKGLWVLAAIVAGAGIGGVLVAQTGDDTVEGSTADEVSLAAVQIADAALLRASDTLADAGAEATDAQAPASKSWLYERTHSNFRLALSAHPRPLMPRAPIDLHFELTDLKGPLSWAVTEGRLRAEIHFVHFVRHDTLGEVVGAVNDSGHFDTIFSVPQTGKYHLKIKLKDGSKTVGNTQMDICVGIDPDAPDADSLCPQLNELNHSHDAAR